MEKYFVTYKQALALKQLGLITKFLGYFDNNGKLCANLLDVQFNEEDPTYKEDDFLVDAPLKSQVFEFFRKQGYDTKVHKEYAKVYLGFYWTGVAWEIVGTGSYEEVEELCIDKLIEIVKNK